MLKIGDVIGEKYHIIGFLGNGGWGEVYLAENVNLGNKWAVKEVDLKRNPRVNLLAEPEILKKLNHSSLPRIVDIHTTDNFLYIIEDYFDGISLKDVIINREVCTEDNVVRWGKDLCEILIYLHNLKPIPIIYMDLKPGNIIIDKKNSVKLIDFGIARERCGELSDDTTFVGTKGYAAPEQYLPGYTVDERADFYSLGATLYHVVTGISPAQAQDKLLPIRQVDKSLSPGLEKIISKCMQEDPALRYVNAEELLDDFNNINLIDVKGKISNFMFPFKDRFRKKNKKSLEKVVFRDRVVGTGVVGIGGTGRGVGCTHTTITTASFLARHGYTVAVVELNENPSLFALSNNGARQGLIDGSFRKEGCDFYPYNFFEDNPLFNVLQGNYDYIILDLGRIIKEGENGVYERSIWYEEIVRADIKLIVAGGSLWQLKELAPYIDDPNSSVWKFIFCMPDKKLFREIKRDTGLNAEATVFNPNPFDVCQEQDEVIARVLYPVFQAGKTNKNRLLFWK